MPLKGFGTVLSDQIWDCCRLTYGNSLEAHVPERVEEERLPERVPVLEVGDGVVWAEVVDGPGHVLDSQGHRPDAVVCVTVEPRILSTPAQVVLRLVLVSGLKHTVSKL